MMRGGLAALLGLCVISTSSGAGWLHIHTRDDHSHPEHQHGLSTHGHIVVEHGHPSGLPRLEQCDPAQHVVRVSLFDVTVPRISLPVAEVAASIDLAPPFVRPQALPVRDLRSHGPPRHDRIFPRAPPV